MAEKTKKDAFRERLQAKYPDKNFEDEEEMYSTLNDDYDAADAQAEENKGYKEREQGLVDMFEADPRSANFLTAWRQGQDPVIALVQLFGPELRDALDDPAKQDDIAKAHKEFLKKVEDEKVAQKTYEENLAQSLKNIDQMENTYNLSDDQVKEAMLKLIGIIKDANQGVYSPETIELVFRGLNYTNDVAQAQQEGEVAGRNQKITEKLRTAEGDGVPSMSGATNPPKERKKQQSIFDLADEAS